jgi:hypothetical protein
MERFSKNFWKGLLTAFGVTGAAMVAYFLIRRFKNRLPTTMEQVALTKEEATRRSELIANLKYTLFLQLNGAHVVQSKNTYEGSVLIDFDLLKVEDIFIDFTGKVLTITNNGVNVPIVHQNGKIHIEAAHLKKENKICVTFTNQYSLESKGMRIYTDTVNMVNVQFNDFRITISIPSLSHSIPIPYSLVSINRALKRLLSCMYHQIAVGR